jgi:hypothetical protein
LGDSNYLEDNPAASKLLKDEWFRQSLYQAVRQTAPSWWERIWVFQEYAAARKPPVFCFGKIKVESIEFKELLQSLHKHGFPSKEQSSYASTITATMEASRSRTAIEHIASLKNCLLNLETLRANKKESLNLLFAEMLKQTADAEATDPRDRIFSLIGFLKPEISDILKPDYERSIGSVCAAATYAYMLEMGITAAFSRVRLSLTKIGECPKPSWAITFDTFPGFGEYTLKTPFSCVLPTPVKVTTSCEAFQFNSKINSLYLPGWMFDHIREIVDQPSAELPPNYNSLFAKFMSFSRKASQYETYIDDPDDLGPDYIEYDWSAPGYSGSNPFMSISPIE